MAKLERSGDIRKLLFSAARSNDHDRADIEHSAENTLVDPYSFDFLQQQLQRVPADYADLDHYPPVRDGELGRRGLDIRDQCYDACDSQEKPANPRQPNQTFVQHGHRDQNDREKRNGSRSGVDNRMKVSTVCDVFSGKQVFVNVSHSRSYPNNSNTPLNGIRTHSGRLFNSYTIS